METHLIFSTVELKISIVDPMKLTFDDDLVAITIDQFEQEPLACLRD
jgi:hypothetical protein